MSRATWTMLAGVVVLGVGMALVMLGIVLPRALLPGIYLVATGLLVLAVGATLTAVGRGGPDTHRS